MSDEESFVILGTSPTASMETDSTLLTANSLTKEFDEPAPQTTSTNNSLDCRLTNSTASSSTSQYSVVNKSTENSSDSMVGGNGVSIAQDKVDDKSLEKSKANSMQNSISNTSSIDENLAANFILGKVDSNVLKSSLQTLYPNALSSAQPVSHISVPKEFMEEMWELKRALYKNTQAFKIFQEQSAKFKKECQEKDEEKNNEIAKLRNENIQLKRDIDVQIEQLKFSENIRNIEQKELIRSLSEKQAQIKNMSVQIEKLEQHQLQSYDFVPKNDQETYQADESTEYVTRHEHQRVVKELERQMSELCAENLELKDMQKQYIDELNCLKVNLVAAEELYKNTQSDIKNLTARDQEKGATFIKYENETKAMKEEISILRQQLDLYSRDFKIEHEARENLANERDQLLSDLREMQKNNQELIKEAQRNYEERARQTMAPTGAFPKRRTLPDPSRLPQSLSPLSTATPTHTCPLCAKHFKTLSVLQEHVNQCLDGN